LSRRPADPQSRGRGSTNGTRLRLVGGAAFFALALVVVACQSSSSAPSRASVTQGPTSAAAADGAPTAAASPAERVAAALAALADGYTYKTSVTLGDKEVSQASGRWVGGAGEFVLETGGQSVTYRAIPPKAWVQKPGSKWVEVQGQLPGGNPSAALANPFSTTIVSDTSSGLVVDGSYPPASLGLKGADPVTVRLTIAGDGTVTAMVKVATTEGDAASTTVFTPGTGLAPVAAP
jgi:hypothetical protein